MYSKAAISAYTNVGIDSGVASADPHKLISMLYQGALLAIANAKNGILRNDTAAKGKSISHAIKIINNGLNLSLDKEVGGDLALNLSALYEYMGNRLVVANLNNDMEILDEVSRLLSDLKSAWDSIRQPSTNNAAAPQAEQQVYAKG